MPIYIKLLISTAVAVVVGLLVFVFDDQLSPSVPGFVIPGLGVVMIIGLWLFPEAGKNAR